MVLELLMLDGIQTDSSISQQGTDYSDQEATDPRFLEADAKRRERRKERLQIAEYAGRRMEVDKELKTLIESVWEKPKSRAAVTEKLMDVGMRQLSHS